MFHRVKSETQTSEEKKQPEREGVYRRSEDLEQREQNTFEKFEEQKTPLFETPQSTIQKKEENTMRTQDETAVQGKYSRQTEERNVAPSEEVKERTYQPSVSRGSAYSAAAPSRSAELESYSGNDRQLTIGRGINMSGEIEACDHLLVEGTVEAALKGAKVLDIAESGTFYGTVEIEEATIAGRFEGDITVNGRLTIKSSGTITGSIAYRELEVEAGAMLDGRMTPLKEAVDQKSVDKYRAGTSASAMAKAKDLTPKKEEREPANADQRLFSKAHASY